VSEPRQRKTPVPVWGPTEICYFCKFEINPKYQTDYDEKSGIMMSQVKWCPECDMVLGAMSIPTWQ